MLSHFDPNQYMLILYKTIIPLYQKEFPNPCASMCSLFSHHHLDTLNKSGREDQLNKNQKHGLGYQGEDTNH